MQFGRDGLLRRQPGFVLFLGPRSSVSDSVSCRSSPTAWRTSPNRWNCSTTPPNVVNALRGRKFGQLAGVTVKTLFRTHTNPSYARSRKPPNADVLANPTRVALDPRPFGVLTRRRPSGNMTPTCGGDGRHKGVPYGRRPLCGAGGHPPRIQPERLPCSRTNPRISPRTASMRSRSITTHPQVQMQGRPPCKSTTAFPSV